MWSTLEKLTITNLDATGLDTTFTVLYNPESIVVERSIGWQRVDVQDTDAQPMQFTGSAGRTVKMDIYFDTSDSEKDVSTTYISKLEKLCAIDVSIHSPPLLKLRWGSASVIGVITYLTVTYTRFTKKGIPVRADVDMTFEETTGVVETELESPDHTKLHTVRQGETLDQIAWREYEDPTHWKTIAEANDLADPSRLTAGQRLTLPRLF